MKLVGEGWELEYDSRGRMLNVTVRDSTGVEYDYTGPEQYREALWKSFMRLVGSGRVKDPAGIANRALAALAVFDRQLAKMKWAVADVDYPVDLKNEYVENVRSHCFKRH